MKKIFAALVGLAAIFATASARAQVSWNSDPVAGVLSRLKSQTSDIPTPIGSPQAAAPASGQPLKLVGEPWGGRPSGVSEHPSIRLVSFVDGRLRLMIDDRCVNYGFPGLRYDAETKKVYLGDRLIARDHGAWHGGLQLEPGLNFEAKTTFSGVALSNDLPYSSDDPNAPVVSVAGVYRVEEVALVENGASAVALAPAPLKLVGNPVGGADVGFEFYSAPSVQLTLAVRSDMDMPPLPPDSVGVRADVQANEPPGEGNGVNPSAVLAFVFPSLRYDKSAKRVYLDDRLIAGDHGVFGGGLRLEKGIRFEYAVVKHREENGFYRGELEVSIVQQ